MQYRPILFSCAAILMMPACAMDLSVNDKQWVETKASQENAIRTVLSDQQSAWNAGDIDAFMSGYWRSPNLRFASGGQVTYGWQQTRDGYHGRYSNRALMGSLSFDELQVDMIAETAAVVHGRWVLTRDSDRPSGLFTLIFKQIDGDWKIVSDTTTSAD